VRIERCALRSRRVGATCANAPRARGPGVAVDESRAFRLENARPSWSRSIAQPTTSTSKSSSRTIWPYDRELLGSPSHRVRPSRTGDSEKLATTLANRPSKCPGDRPLRTDRSITHRHGGRRRRGIVGPHRPRASVRSEQSTPLFMDKFVINVRSSRIPSRSPASVELAGLQRSRGDDDVARSLASRSATWPSLQCAHRGHQAHGAAFAAHLVGVRTPLLHFVQRDHVRRGRRRRGSAISKAACHRDVGGPLRGRYGR